MSKESRRSLLIVPESKSIEETLKSELQPEYDIIFTHKGNDAIKIIEQRKDAKLGSNDYIDLTILSSEFENHLNWIDVNKKIKSIDNRMPVIVYTESEKYGNYPEVFNIKAYILHPDPQELKIKIKEALEVKNNS